MAIGKFSNYWVWCTFHSPFAFWYVFTILVPWTLNASRLAFEILLFNLLAHFLSHTRDRDTEPRWKPGRYLFEAATQFQRSDLASKRGDRRIPYNSGGLNEEIIWARMNDCIYIQVLKMIEKLSHGQKGFIPSTTHKASNHTLHMFDIGVMPHYGWPRLLSKCCHAPNHSQQ